MTTETGGAGEGESMVTEMTQRPLSIDTAETTEGRIERLILENPVIIFSRAACCMCHVMRSLLATLGVHPTVIELDDGEMDMARTALSSAPDTSSGDGASATAPATMEEPPGDPAVFIGGAHVGGLEGLIALHLSGRLVPKLREAGASWP